MPRPTPTTPKGYTRLLHEYNNLNEEYSTLTQQLQENVKSYQEQISENAGIMNEMQETINNLRSQLTDGCASGRISTQVGEIVERIRQTTRRNIFIRNVYNMSGRVVSDIQTRAERISSLAK
jgi:methyl-accepting chemotaxis protein